MAASSKLLVFVAGFAVVGAAPAPGWREHDQKTQPAPRLEWKDFNARRQGFRVSFPGTPQETFTSRLDSTRTLYEDSLHAVDLDDHRVRFAVHCQLLSGSLDREQSRKWLTSQRNRRRIEPGPTKAKDCYPGLTPRLNPRGLGINLRQLAVYLPLRRNSD